jgi:hypothetical protein
MREGGMGNGGAGVYMGMICPCCCSRCCFCRCPCHSCCCHCSRRRHCNCHLCCCPRHRSRSVVHVVVGTVVCAVIHALSFVLLLALSFLPPPPLQQLWLLRVCPPFLSLAPSFVRVHPVLNLSSVCATPVILN